MEPNDSPSIFMHDAFISYSRKDEAFSTKLEKELESYKPPKDLDVPHRYLDVFRDTRDFKGGEYNRNLAASLTDSRKLIVICTPEARASEYVDDEVRLFSKIRGAENIIPILLSGAPNNEAKSDEKRWAFPRALCEVMEMPLAISYLGFHPNSDHITKGVFADAWYTLLANLYDVSRSEIEQREKKRRTRARRNTVTVLSSIIAALSVLSIFAMVSRSQAQNARLLEAAARKEAEQQRSNAEDNAKEANRQRTEAETAREAEKIQREEAQKQRDAAIRAQKLADEQREVAEQQRQAADEARIKAETELRNGEYLRRIATSRSLAYEARQRVDDPTSPEPSFKQALYEALTALDIARADATEDSVLFLLLKFYERIIEPRQLKQTYDASLSKDGTSLVVTAFDGLIRIFDVNTGQKKFEKRCYAGPVRALFTPDGKHVVINGLDRSARLFDLAKLDAVNCNTEIGKIDFLGPITFSDDSERMAIVSNYSAYVYRVSAGKFEPGEFSTHIDGAAISPDGRRLVTFSPAAELVISSFQGILQGKVKLFTVVQEGKTATALTGHIGPILKGAFGPEGKFIVTEGLDGTIRVWDTVKKTGRILVAGLASSTRVILSSNGRFVAIKGYPDGSIDVYDANSDLPPRKLTVPAKSSLIALSPNGRFVLSSQPDGPNVIASNPAYKPGYTGFIYEVGTNKKAVELRGHLGPILKAVFSDDSQLIVTVGLDGSARVWNTSSGSQRLFKESF